MACRSATAAVTDNKTKQTKHKIQGSNTHNSWIKKKNLSKIEPARIQRSLRMEEQEDDAMHQRKIIREKWKGGCRAGKCFSALGWESPFVYDGGKVGMRNRPERLNYLHPCFYSLFFSQKKNIKKEHFEYCFSSHSEKLSFHPVFVGKIT